MEEQESWARTTPSIPASSQCSAALNLLPATDHNRGGCRKKTWWQQQGKQATVCSNNLTHGWTLAMTGLHQHKEVEIHHRSGTRSVAACSLRNVLPTLPQTQLLLFRYVWDLAQLRNKMLKCSLTITTYLHTVCTQQNFLFAKHYIIFSLA